MKALLIQPPIRDYYRTEFREYPLGLLYLASSLKKAGHEVTLLDARKCKHPKKIEPPKIFKKFSSDNGKSLFKNYKHFGLSFEEIEKRVKNENPDYIIISSMFTPYFSEVIGTAIAAKRAAPNCHITVGGHHATVDPFSLAQCEAINQIVLGEGEEILPKLLNGNIAKKVVSAPDEKPFRAANLEGLPLPARELIDPKKYLFEKRPYSMIITSRGCPHRCSFCSVHTVAGHTYRKRSIESVLEEIDDIYNRHGIRVMDFQDDNLLFEKERVSALFEKLAGRFKDVLFLASNGLNVAHLDRELLTLMKKTGFGKLDLAIGTAEVFSRSKFKRPETVEHYENVLKLSLELGFKMTTYIIVGHPAQSLNEIKRTVEYLMKKNTLIAPSAFYNVPGMPVFEEMKGYEYLHDNAARRGSIINHFGKDFDRNDILKILNTIRTHNLQHAPISS